MDGGRSQSPQGLRITDPSRRHAQNFSPVQKQEGRTEMGERGRPGYEPSEKDRRIAEAMAGWAIPQERIAKVIGIDPKTLRKHFAEELGIGSAKLEAQLAQNLLRIAQGQDRQALIATIFALKARFGWMEASPPPREPPLGKKEAAALRAQEIMDGDSEWGDLLKPSPPPLHPRKTQ